MTEMNFQVKYSFKGVKVIWRLASALLGRGMDREQRDEGVSDSLHSKAIDGCLQYLLTTPMKYSLSLTFSRLLSLSLYFFQFLSILLVTPSLKTKVHPIFYHLSISPSPWIYLPLRRILNWILFFLPILSSPATLWSVFMLSLLFLQNMFWMKNWELKIEGVCLWICVWVITVGIPIYMKLF